MQCGRCQRRTKSVAERFFPDGKTYVECCFECANKPNCKHGGKKDDVVPGVSI